MNDRWSSSATLADGGRGRPRSSAWTQILSALVLVCVLALLAVSIAGWIFMAALSTLVLAVVTQTVRSFEFVVITAVTPAVAEGAIADVVRSRRMWSPMPVIRAQVIESVGGSNIHVHQRPRFFWIFVMLETGLLYAAMDEQIYLTLLIFEAATVMGGLLWARELLSYRGENA